MKDSKVYRSKSETLNEAKHMFSLYQKLNEYDYSEYPFIYNFVSIGKWHLYIKKDRKGNFCVQGRLPFNTLWTAKAIDKYVDEFFFSKDYNEARDQFYILTEKLLHLEYCHELC